MNGAIWVRNLRAFLAFRSISYCAVPRRNCRVSCAGPPLMSSSSAMVVLVAISTSVTAMGLLARYRPAGLQAAAAARTRRPGRCAAVSRKGRPCGPTAQELQAGMLVLLDPGFRTPAGSSPRTAAPAMRAAAAADPAARMAAEAGEFFEQLAGLNPRWQM